MIRRKIIIRRFFKYFRRKYRWRKKYWQYFDVLKNFHLIEKCQSLEILYQFGQPAKKIRTANGEKRALYDYDVIAVFEYLQYDVRAVSGKHSLPIDIYEKFK